MRNDEKTDIGTAYEVLAVCLKMAGRYDTFAPKRWVDSKDRHLMVDREDETNSFVGTVRITARFWIYKNIILVSTQLKQRETLTLWTMKKIIIIGLCMFLILLSSCDLKKPSTYCEECKRNCNLLSPLNLTDFQFKNMCCFPLDCPQAENNPDVCTCTYMVKCS